MKNMIETFSALGARLLGFGDDDATRAVIDSACRANGWVTLPFRLRSRGACWSSWPEISRLLVFSTCCACL